MSENANLQSSAKTKRPKGHKEIVKKNNALERLQIEYVPIGSIRPNGYNPNRQDDHEFELLVRSINEDGFTQPIVVQRNTREFVDGEHRWTAAIVEYYLRKNGIAITSKACREARERRLELLDPDLEVPVVFTDMSPEQMRIATLRHNKARGSHDLELEAGVLRDLQQLGALDWAQDSLMMTDVEIQRMLEDVSAPDELHGEEYSEAWVPDKVGDSDLAHQSTSARVVEGTTHGGVMVSAMSYAAIEAMRQREQRISEAKTEEEKQMARKESKLYRLNLIFPEEEGAIIQSVLGEQPAVRLLDLCKAERARSSKG